MGKVIHSKKTPDGIRFRLWSTNCDDYVTNEMTEERMREYILMDAVCRAIEQHNSEIDDRIQRAVSNGTSSMISGRNPYADWDKPLNR